MNQPKCVCVHLQFMTQYVNLQHPPYIFYWIPVTNADWICQRSSMQNFDREDGQEKIKKIFKWGHSITISTINCALSKRNERKFDCCALQLGLWLVNRTLFSQKKKLLHAVLTHALPHNVFFFPSTDPAKIFKLRRIRRWAPPPPLLPPPPPPSNPRRPFNQKLFVSNSIVPKLVGSHFVTIVSDKSFSTNR